MSLVGENRGQTNLSTPRCSSTGSSSETSGRSVCPRLSRFCSLLLAMLREIADEGAYSRHLAVARRAHSAEEWRRFSERRLLAKYARPKCC